MAEINRIVLGDSRFPENYPDTEYHLTVTSPPYFVGKEYEQDYKSFDDYKDMLRKVFHETAARTVDGGKIAINIADIAAFAKVSGRVEENIEVSRCLVDWLKEDDCHLLARYIWHKDDPWANSQHVGYHKGVSATYVRALPNWEYIWVFYKKTPKREGVPSVLQTLRKEQWKKWVSAVWFIRSVQANDFHEAMFPEELVRRLVLLYSIEDDTVFDPFLGSGVTAAVAYKNYRNYAGIERDPVSFELAHKTLAAVENSVERQRFVPDPQFEQNKIVF